MKILGINCFFLSLLIIHCFLLLFRIIQPGISKWSSHYQPEINNRSLYIIITIISALAVSGSWICTNITNHYTKEENFARGKAVLKEYCQSITNELTAIDTAARTMAGSPWIKPVLLDPSEQNLQNANSVLDRYNYTNDTSVCYLLDKSATTLASSNRNAADSFVGKNYNFRPYFLEAIQGESGFYFALGITSGKRGYYSSGSVKNENGNVLGVTVIKKNIDFIEREFHNVPFICLSNKDGIIFLSSNREYLYKALWPLSKHKKEELEKSRQFGEINSEPLFPVHFRNRDIINFGNDLSFFSTQSIDKDGWFLISINRFEGINTTNTISIILSLFLILLIHSLSASIVHYRTRAWIQQELIAEQRFRTIFNHAPGILLIIEKESLEILAVNLYTMHKLGYAEVELMGANLQLLLKEQAGSQLVTGNKKITEQLGQVKYFYDSLGKKQEIILSATDIKYREKDCLLLFANDILKIHKAEQALEESEKLYREMLDTMPQIIFECNINGLVVYANNFGIAYFGFTRQILDKKINMLEIINFKDHKKARTNLEKMITEQCHTIDEYEFMQNNGKTFIGLVHSVPVIRDKKTVGFRGFVIDITKQKENEEEKNRISKLESIGILAGGLAHDFNNILTSISNAISYLKLKLQSNTEIKTLLNDIGTAIGHGKDLTQQLLTFSRGGTPIKEITSIIALIRETADFTLSGSNCQCQYLFANDLWPVDIDKGQISQVIQNLVLNASQAMPGGGTISIKAENSRIIDDSRKNLPKGDYVKITIKDTGKGIPEQEITKIFDPFFTTKEKGTGLGLATVHSIIQKHNGCIMVESLSGKSTTFTIFLPALPGRHHIEEQSQVEIHKGIGRILVMDDDELVLNTCKKLIEFLGYRVETVTNGNQAIELFSRALAEQDAFDIVIMDLTIKGGMGGKETLGELKKINQDIKAVVSSGYSNDPVMANYREYGFSGVISKPYRLNKMSAILHRMMTG